MDVGQYTSWFVFVAVLSILIGCYYGFVVLKSMDKEKLEFLNTKARKSFIFEDYETMKKTLVDLKSFNQQGFVVVGYLSDEILKKWQENGFVVTVINDAEYSEDSSFKIDLKWH